MLPTSAPRFCICLKSSAFAGCEFAIPPARCFGQSRNYLPVADVALYNTLSFRLKERLPMRNTGVFRAKYFILERFTGGLWGITLVIQRLSSVRCMFGIPSKKDKFPAFAEEDTLV
jgi:hypothetical protein